jgi:HSP20 family protein
VSETKDVSKQKTHEVGTHRDEVRWMRPAVDIFEDSTGMTLQADMPGVSKERLSAVVDNDILTLEGSVGIVMPEGMDSLHADVRATHYRREFSLSHEMDTDQVDAVLRDGVVTLRIPKRAEHQCRPIVIRTH